MKRSLTVAPLLLALAIPLVGSSAQPAPKIARLVITPASRTIVAGDTMRLRTEARDAQGNVLSGVTVRYRLGGSARFEGRVDSLGLLTASSTAILPVTVTATMPGAAPTFEVIEITAVPGPAARITLAPSAPKLVVGQRVRATARAYSANGDARSDRMTWKSENPAVASVSATGLVTAVKAGTTADFLMQSTDLYPTLCELAGLPVPPQCDGLSLVPQLRDPDAPRTRVALTSYVFRGDSGPSHAAADSRHRLIRYADGFEELYDLAEDPHEFTNRATDPALAGVKARLSEALPARAASSVGAPVQSSYNLRKTPGKKAKSSK